MQAVTFTENTMKDEHVTIEMFKFWADTQGKTLESLSQEIKETNILLRDDINTTKAILNQHIIEYKENKSETNSRFAQVFKTLQSREDVYKFAKVIKWGIGILLAGGLTAAGMSGWSYIATKQPTEVKQ